MHAVTEPDDRRHLRIAQMCTDFGMGGIARHALDLGIWLEGHGHGVFLAGTPGEWAGQRAEDGFLSIPTRYVGGDGGGLVRRLANTGRGAIALRRWLAASRIDVIHAHESAPALVALLARMRLNIPLVVTYHGSDPQRIKGFGTIARHADLVVTPSHRAAEDLAEIAGVPRDKLRVIGLGIKPPPEDSSEDVAALRSSLLRGGSHLIVTLARVAYQKGIDVLIDCVAAMKDQHPGYRFVVVGDGPLDQQMRALVKQRGLQEHLHFAGRTEVPYRYLRAADLMLLTSRWEALPISIAESLQTGTPIVATDCSGVHELVDDTVGACVPIGDVAAITQAVERILEDEQKRSDMAAQALERSGANRFDPDHINQQIEALYLGLVS
ncbi:glycosyltransferase family 4 protein [Ruegeria sp. 6PALISEP08]|uniref:glycosyltransferase family 4 protein n=1 Tax=Ruegeria sp. 6PALISEP08 TaxID=1225660 RepID=UPI00067E8656|nr:glycosyltransferase family 4 protein [Ruegeria sp. 6PALISEP08]